MVEITDKAREIFTVADALERNNGNLAGAQMMVQNNPSAMVYGASAGMPLNENLLQPPGMMSEDERARYRLPGSEFNPEGGIDSLARAEELRQNYKQSLELRTQAITRLGDLLAKVGDRVLSDLEYEIISKLVHDLSYIPNAEEQRIAITAANKLLQFDEASESAELVPESIDVLLPEKRRPTRYRFGSPLGTE
jgi:hypothetical protein